MRIVSNAKICRSFHTNTLEKRELAKFSEQALTNPIVFAGLCTPCSEKELLNIMTSASESVLVYLVNRMELNAVSQEKKQSFMSVMILINYC